MFLIRNINYIPNIKTTLISSKELTNKGQEILFKKNIALLSYNNNIITIAKWYLNAYFLNNIIINYKVLEPIIYNKINYSPIIYNNNNPVLNLNNSNNNTLLDLYHHRFLYIIVGESRVSSESKLSGQRYLTSLFHAFSVISP